MVCLNPQARSPPSWFWAWSSPIWLYPSTDMNSATLKMNRAGPGSFLRPHQGPRLPGPTVWATLVQERPYERTPGPCLYAEPMGEKKSLPLSAQKEIDCSQHPHVVERQATRRWEAKREVSGLDWVKRLQESSLPLQPGGELAFLFIKNQDWCL